MKPDNEKAFLKLEIVTTAVEKKLTEHRSGSELTSSELVLNLSNPQQVF